MQRWRSDFRQAISIPDPLIIVENADPMTRCDSRQSCSAPHGPNLIGVDLRASAAVFRHGGGRGNRARGRSYLPLARGKSAGVSSQAGLLLAPGDGEFADTTRI